MSSADTTTVDLVLPHVEATEALGTALGRRLCAGQGVALIGELGAGKTAFVRGLAVGLELEDPEAVASPTYLLAIEHDGPVPLLHVDAYLEPKARGFLLDGGLDYADELGAVLAIEWADRVRDLWPSETVVVELGPRPEGQEGRQAHLQGPAALLEGLGKPSP